MLPDPEADVTRVPLVELVKVLWDNESIVPYVTAASDRVGVRMPFFDRKIGKS